MNKTTPEPTDRNAVLELLREARDGLIGNTAIITAGKNHEQAQLAGQRLNDLNARIEAALTTTSESTP